MRPIEFRAWSKIEQRRFYVDGILFGTDQIGEETVPIYILERLAESGETLHNWGDVILLQYTGLLDKNGKKMWERDICKSFHKEEGDNLRDKVYTEIGEIVFNQGAFWLKYIKPYDWDPMCPAELLANGTYEVVGNIYETPELLQ